MTTYCMSKESVKFLSIYAIIFVCQKASLCSSWINLKIPKLTIPVGEVSLHFYIIRDFAFRINEYSWFTWKFFWMMFNYWFDVWSLLIILNQKQTVYLVSKIKKITSLDKSIDRIPFLLAFMIENCLEHIVLKKYRVSIFIHSSKNINNVRLWVFRTSLWINTAAKPMRFSYFYFSLEFPQNLIKYK